jgi:DNA-binding NtrC family response regulator
VTTDSPRGRVLVADDEESVRWVLAKALEEAGHSVLQASGGTDALAQLEAGGVDLAFVDLRMPDLDGLSVLGKARERDVQTPIIIITAQNTMDNAIEAMKRGAYDYITKPFNVEEVRAIATRALDMSRLTTDLHRLERELRGRFELGVAIVGSSAAMQEIYKTIGRIAKTDATVLIQGESGTGKELIAKVLHYHSNRWSGPFVAINCAAIPRDLLESELFGHERGAFTGADQRQEGYFEMADDGSIFLDEITEMSPDLQVKLLRVLEQNKFRRIGGRQEIEIDVRVISATNRDPFKAIEEHKLREDLYYRLNVFPIHVPSLRDRLDDIPLLASYFLEMLNEKEGKNITSFEPEVLQALQQHSWPGNVRELRNVINRAYILAWSNTITVGSLPNELKPQDDARPRPRVLEIPIGLTLEEIQRRVIAATLEYVSGDTSKADELLGIPAKPLVELGAALERSTTVAIRVGSSLEEVEKLLITKTLELNQGNKPRTAESLGISLKTLYNKLERYESRV